MIISKIFISRKNSTIVIALILVILGSITMFNLPVAQLPNISPPVVSVRSNYIGANAQTVEAGFRIILRDPKVKAILINIFGGIVRCDRVAQGVIDAYNSIGDISIPIIVRLQGTNAAEAKALIEASGLKVQSAILLREAAALDNQAVSA